MLPLTGGLSIRTVMMLNNDFVFTKQMLLGSEKKKVFREEWSLMLVDLLCIITLR